MAEIPGVPLDERGAPTEVFGDLIIERRVLLAGSRTISIPNIASISIGNFPIKPSGLWLISAGASGILSAWYFMASQNSFARDNNSVGIAFLFFALAAALLVIWAMLPRTTQPYLIITTNDGTRSLFSSGHSHETLEKVRRVLSDKINAQDEAATYTVNFATGVIENLNLEKGASLNADTVVAGDGNQVVANSPGGRIATADQTFSATSSPGAQIGFGNTQAGNTLTVTYIDYSGVLPQIEQMHRFYARDPNAAHVAERLSEMEVLMRSGTPTEPGRSRIRVLATDLSTILQGYPPLVQFFHDIVRLATG